MNSIEEAAPWLDAESGTPGHSAPTNPRAQFERVPDYGTSRNRWLQASSTRPRE
jgi:hypothetical protein